MADQQCFSKNIFIKKARYLEIHQFSPMFLCGQQEEERWKEAGTFTASTQYWLRYVTYHYLDTYQNGQHLIENRISRHVCLKTYLRWSHKITNPQLIFKNCRIKACFDALVYDLLTSRLFHHFLMSAQSGSTRYNKALPNKISSDRTS